MNSDKAEIFSQAWAKNGHELVERLKLSIFTPKKVKFIIRDIDIVDSLQILLLESHFSF